MNELERTFGDTEVRRALRSHLLAGQASVAETVVIEELGLCRGQVRVDLATVNELLHGFEIKSDRDSLCRLAGQADIYSRVLDRATLVVGSRHLAEAVAMVPRWWGVLRIDRGPDGPCFKAVRRARQNPDRNPRSLVELLWLEDAIALLALRDAGRGARGKPRREVWDRVCEHFHVDEIAAVVRATLKTRVTTQVSS